jgi:exosortase
LIEQKARFSYQRLLIHAQMDHQSSNGILEDFRIEFLEYWRRLPNKGFFLVLLAVWLVLFCFLGSSNLGYIHSRSLIYWMYFTYNTKGNESEAGDAHGNLIPFVVLALLWWKRKELFATELKLWWPGLGIFVLGLGIHIVGFMVQQARVSIVGLFVGIYGLTGLAWGLNWLRKSFFPFFLFAFMIPLGTLALPVSFRLRLWVSEIVQSICGNLLMIDINRNGTALIDPSGRFQYEVAAACSGIRSLIATLALSIVYAWLSLGKWWKRGILIASAIPLALLGNVMRMLLIVLASELGGRTHGQDWGNFVHENLFFSLVPYVPAFAGLMLLGHWLREPSVEPRKHSGSNSESNDQSPESGVPVTSQEAETV